MKALNLLAHFCFGASISFAQQNTGTNQRTVQLDDVVVKASDGKTTKNKVKQEHVFVQIPPTNTQSANHQDGMFMVTGFQKVEDAPVVIDEIELKLKPFDTSLFDLKLIIFQIANADTNFWIMPVPAHDIRNKKLVMKLWDAQVELQPEKFFIGYGIHSKNKGDAFSYRLYSGSNGESAMLNLRDSRWEIMEVGYFVFPFKIKYRKI